MINTKLVLFDYHKITKKGFPIKVSITNGATKQQKYINLKIYSHAEHWDKITLEPKRSHPNYFELLELILEYKTRIVKANNISRTSSWSIDQVIAYINKDESNNEGFFKFADFHIAELRKFNKDKTADIKQTAINSFFLFNNSLEIGFDDVTPALLKKYRDWGINSDKFTSNGMHSYLSKLKSIYNDSIGSTLPFKGVMPKLAKTKNKHLTLDEMCITAKLCNANLLIVTNGYSSIENYLDYFMLCFYLGGIDLIDLANLKYSEHVKNGRLIFQRQKGGTDVWIDNVIPVPAFEILKKYNTNDFLVPIFKAPEYRNFRSNFNRRLRSYLETNEIESYVSSKSPRYSFINLAKNSGVARELTEEIVGHSKNDVHSIYEGSFPIEVKNAAHLKISESIY